MKLPAIFAFCIFISSTGLSQSKIETTDTSDWERSFTRTEAIAQFPGGDSAWAKFISSNLRYPKVAKKKSIEGIVKMQFVVNRDGSIRDIEVISGPEELRPEAERLIKTSPDWQPALQGGRTVKYRVEQSITFKLSAK